MSDLLGFTCAADAIRWLTENRDDQFAWTYHRNRMIGGFRSDDGEIHAFDCAVIEYRSELTRRKVTKGKGVAAIKGLRGTGREGTK